MKTAHRNSPFSNNGANTNASTQDAKKQENKKMPRRITNSNPTPIKEAATISTEWSTTNKLAKQINTIMKLVFEDYYGTLIGVNQTTGEIAVTMMFRPLAASASSDGDDKRAFLPVADRVIEAGGNRLEAAISMVNQAQMKSSNFELSSYGAELLYDLILPQFRGKIDPFNPKTYKNFISEVTRGNQFGFMSNGTVYCSINIIDIAKLITLVHGEKDEDSQVVYNVGVVRPMVTDASGNTKNWVISISGMTRAALEKTMNELGAIMSDGDFVITGTM